MSLRPHPASFARHAVRLALSASRPHRSLAASGALLAALLATAALLLARDLHDGTVRDTERSLSSLVILLAEGADRALQTIEVVEDAVVDDVMDPDVQGEADFARRTSSFAIHDRLEARMAALPQLRAVSILDARGQLLNSSLRWPAPDADLSGRDAIAAMTADASLRRFVSGALWSRVDGAWTFNIVHKVSSSGGLPLGFIVAAVNLRYFEDLYTRVSPDAADVTSIVHRDGTVLVRYPNPPHAVGTVVPPMVGLRSSAPAMPGQGVDQTSQEIGRVTSLIDGLDRFIVTQNVAHFPLIVGASRTVDAALAAWTRQAAALAVAVALLIAGLFAVLWIAARQIRGHEHLVLSEAARVAAEERARGERLLRQDYARFGAALDSMSQGLCLFDAAHDLVVANARFAAIYAVPEDLCRPGTSLGALLDHLARELNPEDGPRFACELRAAAAARVSAELTCELADGRIVGVSAEPVVGGGFVCTHEDETERRRAEATIAHMAHHDALTGLPNRVLLRAGMERLLASSAGRRGGALLALDLDGFKQVNDVHGHPFGDALLRQVAARLGSIVGEADLLARLGGDEFAVIQRAGCQPTEAVALAERIVSALRAPFQVEGVSVAIGTSIGIALAEAGAGRPDPTPEQLLHDADVALYRAKSAGRGAWCLYEAHMEREILLRRALEQDLRGALDADQFELHYQPVVGARGGAVAGYEALLRWRHPERGLVSPAVFIPIAEETGLIREIGAWVLARACSDAAAWPDPLTVAVNLSPVQFREPELLLEVGRALAASGLPARRLELEITESVLLKQDRANSGILQELHRLGLRIAMDDFGTGYSSLSYLRSFPFDKIKIDQSFVRDLFGGAGNLAILRAAIGLGRALGMTVLAEGVETAEQRDMLTAEGCHELQGYLFGRPRPLSEIEAARHAA